MEPFFFGAPGHRLLGVYHASFGARSRDCGVVLCYPMGREYLGALRGYLRLANELSDLGFPVLRFDYFGCGDSEGDCGDGSLARWCEDVSTAVEELHRRSGVSRFCLAGHRLGATIATMAHIDTAHLEALVLVDPIVQGAAYLAQLRDFHRQAFGEVPSIHARRICRTPAGELLGFAFSESLRIEIGAIDLLKAPVRLPKDVLLIQTASGESDRLLRAHLASAAPGLEWRLAPMERISARDLSSSFRSLLRPATAVLISSWMDRVCP